MKENLIYINTNVKCVYKLKKNTKNQYIENLQKIQYFRRG